MMYSPMQLAWLFFIYSLVGWCAEVCYAAIQHRKFVNRGFVNSPFCPIYGFGAVLLMLFLSDLTTSPFFLFLGGAILSTVLEYITALTLEKVFHKKLWDYSHIRYNIGGYVCLRYTVLWGVLSVLTMLFFNPMLCRALSLIPSIISHIILICLTVLLVLDFLTTAMAVLGMKIQAKQLASLTKGIQHTSKLLENTLTKQIQKRMTKSFPSIEMDTIIRDFREKLLSKDKANPQIFAAGCSFYKLVCLFFIGAFLGDITETVFCLVTTHRLMSRSSVVYGPFSIVWGLGCAFLTLFLYRYKDKSDRYIFCAGTLLGGAYEYICSVFTELVFGTIFWDYSGFTFNLGGRINLLYCFFWGIAAVVWLKLFYPFLSRLIEKIPKRPGTVICNLMIVFMLINIIISSMALTRYTERNTIAATAHTEETSEMRQILNQFLDSHFTDERMERIYPNAKIVDNM